MPTESTRSTFVSDEIFDPTGRAVARNDNILDRSDPRDEKQYDDLIKKAFQAKRKIETGFIELAESILEIHKRKLYRLRYKTFDVFCSEELGFSRQTIYVYLSILKLIRAFPNYFPRDKAIDFGHKKMRYITEGASKIDRRTADEQERKKAKVEIFKAVSPKMPSTEVEEKISEIVKDH